MPSLLQPKPLTYLLSQIETASGVNLGSLDLMVPFGRAAIFDIIRLAENLSSGMWWFIDIQTSEKVERNVSNAEFALNPYSIAYFVADGCETICLVSTDEESGAIFTKDKLMVSDLSATVGFSLADSHASFEFSKGEIREPGYAQYAAEWQSFIGRNPRGEGEIRLR